MEDNLSHLEQRIIPGELMVPQIANGETAVLTAMSLSVLEASGFYLVDYSEIDGDIAYGKGSCAIANDFCRDWPEAYNTCPNGAQNSNTCTFDRGGFGLCTILDYGQNGRCPLSQPFQNVIATGCRGGEQAADFCPRNGRALNCKNEEQVAGINVQEVKNSDKSVEFGQEGGSESICVTSAVLSKGFTSTSNSTKVGCHVHRCSASGVLSLKVGDTFFECPRNGGQIATETSDLQGSVVCPPALEVCCSCENDGRCVLGQCVCKGAWTGAKCNQRRPALQTNTMPNPYQWKENPFGARYTVFAPPQNENPSRSRNSATTSRPAFSFAAMAFVCVQWFMIEIRF